MSGSDTTLYQAVISCLSEGDRIEILSGLRMPKPGEEFTSGELPGSSWALHMSTAGVDTDFPGKIPVAEGEKQRKLWEVGRRSELFHDGWAELAFILYRSKLAAFLKTDVKVAPEHKDLLFHKPADRLLVSRCLSPSTLLKSSGVTDHFVVLGQPPVDMGGFDNRILSRPMRAKEALVLVSLLTLVYGAPPMVFGVIQSHERLGQMPNEYRRITFVDDTKYWPAGVGGDDIGIVV